MPIYEYLCQNCGAKVEKLQKLSDAPLTLCPHCKEHALQKLVSSAGFKLKGNGWYETDFKHKTPKSEAVGTQSSDKNTANEKTQATPAKESKI